MYARDLCVMHPLNVFTIVLITLCIFFSDVNLFMELLMTQRQFLQAIEVN